MVDGAHLGSTLKELLLYDRSAWRGGKDVVKLLLLLSSTTTLSLPQPSRSSVKRLYVLSMSEV